MNHFNASPYSSSIASPSDSRVHAHGLHLTLLVALVFALIHVPTSIHFDYFDMTQEISDPPATSPVSPIPFANLSQEAEKTLNGGMTPLLHLKTYRLTRRTAEK